MRNEQVRKKEYYDLTEHEKKIQKMRFGIISGYGTALSINNLMYFTFDTQE